jgi:predicted DNA-binding transcriptional regulator YafY
LFDLSGESLSGQHFHVVRAVNQADQVAEGVGHRGDDEAAGDGLRQKIGMAFPPEERLRVARLRRRILHGPPASHRISGEMTLPRPSVLRPVQDGFFEQRALEIAYAAPGERTVRVVEPHYLLLTWPAWYLVVWGHLRSAPRTLRLDRIESARLTEATFQLREASELVPWAARAFATV